MKKTTLMLALALLIGSRVAAEEPPTVEPLPGFPEQLSYTLGMDIGQALKKVESKLDYTVVIRGLLDTVEGKPLLVTPEQAKEIKEQLTKDLRLKQFEEQKRLAEKNLREGEAFLAANKEKPGVVTTASGLQYEVLQTGEGPKAQLSDTVSVHYRGTLIDGKEFDSSYSRGEPVVFPLKDVIPGWSEGVQLMPVGSKYRFFVPASLAYGERNPGPQIGANAVLLFDLELLAIK